VPCACLLGEPACRDLELDAQLTDVHLV
jgi:hypothetical protein